MKQEQEDDGKNISRRKFLKKAGLGLAGVGAFSMLPASAVDIKSSNLKFFGTDSTVDMNVSDGVVNLSGSNRMTLPQHDGSQSNAPSGATTGDMWYDTNAD